MRASILYISILLLLGCQNTEKPDWFSLDHSDSAGTKKIQAGEWSVPQSDKTQFLANGKSLLKLNAGATSDSNFMTYASHSGSIVRIQTNGQTTEKSTLQIMPSWPTDFLWTFSSPRSMLVGGEEIGEVIGHAEDTFGNFIADGPLKASFLRPNFQKQNKTLTDLDMLHRTTIRSEAQTGKTLAGSSFETSFSKEHEIIEKPNWPQKFSLSHSMESKLADGRQLSVIRTSRLKDAYGNIVSDGTLVTFTYQIGSNHFEIFGSTLDGIATAYIQNPLNQREVVIQAHVGQVVFSNKMVLRFTLFCKSIPYAIHKNNAIQIGPVIGPLGQRIPEGSLVTIQTNKREIKLTFEGGKVNWTPDKDERILKISIGEIITPIKLKTHA